MKEYIMTEIIPLEQVRKIASDNLEAAIERVKVNINEEILHAVTEGKERVVVGPGSLLPKVVLELRIAGYIIHPVIGSDYHNMEQNWVIYWGNPSDKAVDSLFDEDDKGRAFTS